MFLFVDSYSSVGHSYSSVRWNSEKGTEQKKKKKKKERRRTDQEDKTKNKNNKKRKLYTL